MSDPTRKYPAKSAESGGDDDDVLSPFQQVQNWFDGINSSDYDGHDASIARLLKLESVTFAPTSNNANNSRNVMSFTVSRQLCNMGGSLHGGAVALIFDITTSMAITPCMREGFWDRGHVSRNCKCNLVNTIGLSTTCLTRPK
ncbi:hypothetical protein ACET3X_005516 [Alternaria dauci]|uniref:Thioesterase domain-containing protein n=1 Tax=Alternaria dauci TaxID=48095 RepID=A0ABR3UKH8_9PLEO